MSLKTSQNANVITNFDFNLSAYIDQDTGLLWLKDSYGNIAPASDYLPTPSSGADLMYIANYTQSGTSNPFTTVLRNTTGELDSYFLLQRAGVGTYIMTLAGKSADEVFISINSGTINGNGLNVMVNKWTNSGNCVITIKSYNASNVLADDIMSSNNLQIIII